MIKVEEGKVTSIDRKAENISIPTDVVSIGPYACVFSSIRSLHLEKTQIVIIDQYAFSNCYYLQEITFPSSLEEIGEGAFNSCINIQQISFPSDSKLRKIGNGAFKACKKLEFFDFPPLLEFIGAKVFEHCRLNVLDLRKTKIKSVGKLLDTMRGSAILFPSTISASSVIKNSNIKVEIEINQLASNICIDGCGYCIANKKIYNGRKSSSRIFIHRGIEKISQYCFEKSKITSITIPASVISISKMAFSFCRELKRIHFAKNSRLQKIGRSAFSGCHIEKIYIPKSVKVLECTFNFCDFLKEIVFPSDSQLERICGIPWGSKIRHLSLPPSTKEISYLSSGIRSIYVNGEYLKSNEEKNAVFSKDGTELVCVVGPLKEFEIPNGVRVIKKGSMNSKISDRLIIPSSVEVIEEGALNVSDFRSPLKLLEFSKGSKLKLRFDSLPPVENLILNNENYVTKDNGVIMSLDPPGIVFVPKNFTEIEIENNVEVIFAFAFFRTKIKSLKFPKSLKKILDYSLNIIELSNLEFEEGTELEVFASNSLIKSTTRTIERIKLPLIKGKIGDILSEQMEIELPSNFNPSSCDMHFFYCTADLPEKIEDRPKFIIPKSSIRAAAHINFLYIPNIFIIEDH